MRTAITIVMESGLGDWDLGGVWITPGGHIEVCDHDIDLHHTDIAFNYFKDNVELNDEGEYDDYSLNSAQELAYHAGWIHITIMGNQLISIRWKVPLSKISKNALIKYLMNTAYRKYEVRDINKSAHFTDQKSLIGYIRRAK